MATRQRALRASRATSTVAARKSSRRIYAKAPIEEAICEFRFDPGREWDITLPGRIFDKLKTVYSKKPEDLFSGSSIGLENRRPRILLSTEDGFFQLRVREDALTIHATGVYPGWEAFYEKIRESVSAFIKITEPETIARIRLQYRNRINIPGESFAFADYFTIGTVLPNGIPRRLVSFHNAIRIAFDDDIHKVMSVTFSSVAPSLEIEGYLGSLLNVEVSRNHIHERVALRKILLDVRDLKKRESQAFEALITDRTRELFV